MRLRAVLGIALAAMNVGSLAAAQGRPVRVLIAVHSDTGQTARLGEAVRDGAARVDDVVVVLRSATDVTDDEIRQADGIVLGTPVQWAGPSADAKRFLDRMGTVLGPAFGEGRTGAAFCTGGAVSSGKELARLSILAAFLNMRFVLIGGVESDGFGTLGAQATTGPESPGLSESELDEGRRFGERYARLTAQISRVLRP